MNTPKVKKSDVLEIGGDPRVDLLPPEVGLARKAMALRRQLGVLVVGVVLVTVVGTGASFGLSAIAEGMLAAEQERTTVLLAEQGKFLEVRAVQGDIALVTAAQRVGVSTEINWKSYLDQVRAVLPGSVAIDTVKVESASPLEIYAQPTTPLQGERSATLEFRVISGVFPDVPAWLVSLEGLPGFADALPSSVSLESVDGGAPVYSVNITMHVNEAAFSQRFETPKE
ncbi:hypothetical protein [Glaciibacter psychrotolerans]|uniref:Tfp pilus assembly protein PilN n=1 Tax=Glaciibacter psychrotolerans TaxID=670054 RepID=A0A7Z0J844_9MICO|nr:hypothetical protein [Leifsonia psychrotolerans]NYJ21529.1 Tfp pilus assembly protein PilN [Leifsonia psychrotolerans]